MIQICFTKDDHSQLVQTMIMFAFDVSSVYIYIYMRHVFYLHFIYFLWIHDIWYLYIYIYMCLVPTPCLIPLPSTEACQGAMESICELIGSSNSVELGDRGPRTSRWPIEMYHPGVVTNVAWWVGRSKIYHPIDIQSPPGIWTQQEYYINKYLCWEIFGCHGVCRLRTYICTGRLKRTSDDWSL